MVKKVFRKTTLHFRKPDGCRRRSVTGCRQAGREISREQKSRILEVFTEKFGLNQNQALDFFSATALMLQTENNFVKNIEKVIAPAKDKFTQSQVESTIELLQWTMNFANNKVN